MTVHEDHGSTLSAQRAFVVHLAAIRRPGRRRFSGRVEHLSSGGSAPFSSVEALLAFFTAVLDAYGASSLASPPAAPQPRRRPRRP